MNTPQTDEELIEAFDEMFLSDKTFKSKSGRYEEEFPFKRTEAV